MSAQIIAIDRGNPSELLASYERARLISAALRQNGYKAADTLSFREDHEWHILRNATPSGRRISELTRAEIYRQMRQDEEIAAQCSGKETA